MDKVSIRKYILSRRDSMHKEIRKGKDREIKESLLALSEFQASYKILLYASFRSEVDTTGLIEYCLAAGKVTVLPKVAKVDGINSRLRLYEIKEMAELSSGYYGIPEPDVSEDRSMRAEDMDLVIIPGVAFDEDCQRLGYGKGFYDKLLSEASPDRKSLSNGVRSQKSPVCVQARTGREVRFIGLAYEEQIVESIPSEPHDIKMDKIITDKRIIECCARKDG